MKKERPSANAIDGRALRSERSRELIADALYELLREGDTIPSAQKVADRAGVGIRTVFRLFKDMDALYATVNARLEFEFAPMLRDSPPEEARLTERAAAMVRERAALFERVAVFMRFTNRNRDRSPFLTSEYRKLTLRLRARLLHWIPKLNEAEPALIEALDQATSFEAWDRLRNDQRLSRPRAQAAMEYAAQVLVKELENGK